ncbi:MAG: hypothetical protein EOO16_04325 [Chitinophagaceae bacterium]|nr:MAG: hypothetical protein EOO16_04325 [Chitinophagaceae bacterium]
MFRKPVLIAASVFATTVLNAQEGARPYRNALGARYEWAANYNEDWKGISYKHFLGRRTALEGQLLFGGDAIVPDVSVQYHSGFRAVPGLYSYVSAGVSLPFYDTKPDLLLRPGVGLEYKIPRVPLNFGFEWRPSYRVSGDDSYERFVFGRFSIPLRYTF